MQAPSVSLHIPLAFFYVDLHQFEVQFHTPLDLLSILALIMELISISGQIQYYGSIRFFALPLFSRLPSTAVAYLQSSNVRRLANG